MADSFSSKALQVNLARTRDTDINIPDEQQWFINLSKSKWGIYKRTQEFITELNHKYINYQYVIESLHNISLTDLWFYNNLKESEKALSLLVNIFSKLIDSELSEEQRELLVKTLIKFIDRLANLEGFPKSIIDMCLNIIDRDMEDHILLYVKNSGYFKSYLYRISDYSEFSKTLVDMTAKLLGHCIDYWENTSKAEEWLSQKRFLFHSLNQDKVKNIGKPFFDGLRSELKAASDWNQLNSLMYFNDISNYFRSFTDQFESSLEKIYYLYYLLHLPGMTHLNDHLLYDMNRHLRNILKELDENDITAFLDTIMLLFEELKTEHSGTVLDCILTLGKEVIDTKDHNTISYYVKGVKLGSIIPAIDARQ